MKKLLLFTSILMFLFSCQQKSKTTKPKNNSYQAISLLGDTLYAQSPSEKIRLTFKEKMREYDVNTLNAEKLIWYGRWAAYSGDYLSAIKIFSTGIIKFPNDARFFRHRGHRYISLRKFDLAINDFNKAIRLIQGKEDQVEPDGMPNKTMIPVSTLHTNIYYHLGLAYYMKGDYTKAIEVYKIGIEVSKNDDMIVAFTHWVYMATRLIKQDKEAQEALDIINREMNIIENKVYYNLCLFYKGIMSLEQLAGKKTGTMKGSNEILQYGIGNWYFYNNEPEKAEKIFKQIIRSNSWSSFGFIAAETYLAKNS